MDSLTGNTYADKYLDLVALGNTADMMDLRSIETKHLIVKGFREENIHNPFILGMMTKNAFSIGSKLTSMGAAFYIAPFVNAMVRSGEKEEKEILFQSMLNFKAYEKILSNKRGHKPGEMENLVTQALRTATNVKSRQKRIEDATLEKLEGLIEKRKLLEHKVLMFLLEPGEVDRNVAGLIANKFMAKYQRPCCILTKVTEKISTPVPTRVAPLETEKISYQGSARGCDLAGVSNFKDICEQTGLTLYQTGHQGAFGLGVAAENIDAFLTATDTILADMSEEPVYYVDYQFDNNNADTQAILDISYLDDLWGSCMPEPYVAFKNLKVKKEMVTVYRKKNLTLKIQLPNFLSIMLFNAPEELCDMLQNNNPGYYILDIVGYCKKNEWNGSISPQVFIEDYDIIDQVAFDF